MKDDRQSFDPIEYVDEVYPDLPMMGAARARKFEQLIVDYDLKDTLELGFYKGKSSAYIGAILKSLGRGHHTAIDMHYAEPHEPNIEEVMTKLELLDQVFLADFNGKLRYNMTPLYKKIHEFFDLSYNSPILNKKLIEFSSHLDYKKKYDFKTNQGKIPLMELCKKFGMNDLISKGKKGFSIDTKNLWKDGGKEICRYFLADARIIKDGWINKEWIEKTISNDDLDYRYVNKFLGLLAFEIWYRLFITKEISPDEKLNF